MSKIKYILNRLVMWVPITILLVGNVIAQDDFWQSSHGPFGSNMTNTAKILIAPNGNIIVSDYGKGIFISTDVGETWEVISNGLPTQYVSTIAIDSSSILWIGTNVGIFSSTDYGKNWSHNLTPDTIRFVQTISISSEGHVFAGLFESGIIRSTDGGKTWSQLKSNLPWGTYKTVFITKKDILLTSPFWGEGIFRSTDRGQSWNRVGFDNPTRFAWSFVEISNG